ncbi:hypothetical protein [Streptomyces kaniharaensis]|uniref:hypothetical protein n=1 Tax=Streptomyces kaniharaensis TaxID=212423 RepID=UPI001294CB95|nr:hypothetical protein [Streptomyces kaniharaensis]
MAKDRRGYEGARIISALEQAWAAIRAANEDVPRAVIITGSGQPNRKGKDGKPAPLRRGQHRPDRWAALPLEGESRGERRLPEVFVAGELLHMGGEAVMETLLREAAHGIGAVRGEKTQSSQGGRWHNRRWAAIARELGLEPPSKAEPVVGFARAKMGGPARAHFAAAIRAIERASLPYLDGGEGQGEEPNPRAKKPPEERTAGKRVAADCSCTPPRRLQLTPKNLQDGPILCGICDEPFVEQRRAEVEQPAVEQPEAEPAAAVEDDADEPGAAEAGVVEVVVELPEPRVEPGPAEVGQAFHPAVAAVAAPAAVEAGEGGPVVAAGPPAGADEAEWDMTEPPEEADFPEPVADELEG